MAADLASTALTTLLGGGSLAAVLAYLVNRRKTGSDANVVTFANLTTMNTLLTEKLAKVQAQLDAELSARRGLEDELATERRARRALEERVAALERNVPPSIGGDPLA